MRATMPAKMMKLMPLPMPRSVISSPIHITSTVPAGERDHLGQRGPGSRMSKSVTTLWLDDRMAR